MPCTKLDTAAQTRQTRSMLSSSYVSPSNCARLSKTCKHHVKHPVDYFSIIQKKVVTHKDDNKLFRSVLNLAVVVILFFPVEIFVSLLC